MRLMRRLRFREALLDLLLIVGGGIGAWRAYWIENVWISASVIVLLAMLALTGLYLLVHQLTQRH